VSTHEIGFRPLLAGDMPLLAGWLAQPHVATWWCEPSDLPSVREKYLPCLDGRDPTELFVIQVDGVPAGFIQRYLVADNPEWERALAGTGAAPDSGRAAGIDYLIGDRALTGKGLGSAAIRQFTALAFGRYPQAVSVLVDVSQANVASWRALEKAGYVRCWAGEIDSSEPSDEGPSYLYRKLRELPPVCGTASHWRGGGTATR
jgi:aminoglycoside 6'-N-acetyltransferase